jgi:tetratricopeptide (TPR) repeat protein
MQSSAPTNDTLNTYYTTANDALCEIASTYFFRGRLNDTLRLLASFMQIMEASEATSQDRLKLLLLYGKVLTVEQLIHRGEPDLMFAIIQKARQLAEETKMQHGLADALSLLGQAHCNATTVALIKSGVLPFGPRDQGRYEEALTYQEEAFRLMEALQDTRGICEAHFHIGLVYQFWQQNDLAREHFIDAIQIAEKAGYVLERAEPYRHLTVDALFSGDLEAALMYARNALSFREASGFRLYQPLDHLTLRDIYLRQGDTAQAQVHLQQATTLAEEMGFSEMLASMINNTRRLGD